MEVQFFGHSGTASMRPADVSAWETLSDEGQLAMDVYDAGEDIIVVAPMAGADMGSIEISLHQDILTVRGRRLAPGEALPALLSECFWGTFSRTLVLPAEVKGELATAQFDHGILTITIPKRATEAKVPIRIVDE